MYLPILGIWTVTYSGSTESWSSAKGSLFVTIAWGLAGSAGGSSAASSSAEATISSARLANGNSTLSSSLRLGGWRWPNWTLRLIDYFQMQNQDEFARIWKRLQGIVWWRPNKFKPLGDLSNQSGTVQDWPHQTNPRTQVGWLLVSHTDWSISIECT